MINGADYIIASFDNISDVYDVESFEYDKNGNRTKLIQNGDVYYSTYGVNNRLLKVEVKKKDTTTKRIFTEYIYDGNGNTTKRIITKDDGQKDTIDFAYDTMNRLTRTLENGKITEYSYDNAGNRLIKKTDKKLTVYLRHGQIAVAMDLEVNLLDPTSDVGSINRYVLSGDLLAGRLTTTFKTDGTKETTKFYYHLDHLNSTKCVTDKDGKLDVMYEYRAFGEELKKLGNGDAKYTYGGKELDDGTNLYYFNARYYDATIGRFINVDPVQDGVNWYGYCGNNPLNAVDPTGLKVLVQAHNVTKKNQHASFRIVPENQKYWVEHKEYGKYFIKGADGKYYATIGAGPTKGLQIIPESSKLNAGINRSRDADLVNVPKIEEKEIKLGKQKEDDVISNMFKLEQNYEKQSNNKIDYDLFPNKKGDGYNSNSFVKGLGEATGLEMPKLDSNVPGYDKPVPKQYFEPSQESNKQVVK